MGNSFYFYLIVFTDFCQCVESVNAVVSKIKACGVDVLIFCDLIFERGEEGEGVVFF